MPVVELTDKHCRTKAKPGQQLELVDTMAKGLVLRISGGRDVRAWRFHYRYRGKRGWLGLGLYPEVTLSVAREKARAARGKLADDIDPAAPETEQRMTIAELVEAFVVRPINPAKRDRGKTRSKVARRLRKNVVPLIGELQVERLHKRDIIRCLDPINKRGSPIEARRVFEDLKSMCNWARKRGVLEQDLFLNIEEPAKSPEGTRVLSADEIAHIWHRLPHEPMIDASRNCLKLILITGQRPGECSGIHMDELSIADRLWTIPADRSKNGKVHVVPLSDLALELIKQQRTAVEAHAQTTDRPVSPYLFPVPRGGKPLASGGVSHAVQRRGKSEDTQLTMGIRRWTAHSLRRTVATNLGELGVAPFTIAHVLGHISVTKASVTTRVYVKHEFLDEKRAALELWAERLRLIIGVSAESRG